MSLIYTENELSSVTLSHARLQGIQAKGSHTCTLVTLFKKKSVFFDLVLGLLLMAWIFFFFDKTQDEFPAIMPLNY